LRFLGCHSGSLVKKLKKFGPSVAIKKYNARLACREKAENDCWYILNSFFYYSLHRNKMISQVYLIKNEMFRVPLMLLFQQEKNEK